MYNVLILENLQGLAVDTYEVITQKFPGCKCYPEGPYTENSFREMNTLIQMIIVWAEEADKEKKIVLESKLVSFLKKHILKDEVPDFAIIDVSLLQGSSHEGMDEYGARFRLEILAAQFPNLSVLYSTVVPEKVNEIYRLKNDTVLDKMELADFTYFKELLEADFARYSSLKPKEISDKNTQKPNLPGVEDVIKTSTLVKFRTWTRDFGMYAITLATFLKYLTIFLSVCFYVLGFCIVSFNFLKVIYAGGTDQISKYLETIEKLFIIPLPMIIASSFFIFFDHVIFNKFDPARSRFSKLEIESKYYINLSKSLFISTLISVLGIGLLERSIDENTNPDFRILALIAATIILFVFYLIIAKSLHAILKSVKLLED